ncbi:MULTISPECIES: hypothetical protein [Pseudomonas]|jgi:hypothetical protein|uniref:Uncharacterized protein n=1 Tax=Pseudomonas chlororaphis TaxID=587753 RepID=A0AB34CDE7_9PSED|nr:MULTISPECIES: hypothetical protein [Pseudomonas]AMS14829.1 hypothetical protein A3218_11185 [Pseudomonas chlororaphis]AUF99754.1 hypothetical protein CXQ81_03825 [Pseudomonas sp. 09C 129]EJL00671.1 hypothetical protein Pchl3084_0319 [Pseudomonas chlororaphis subsp. aureofaciens 30-84]KAA5845436.1 hypothetical protein F2A38_01045 [Pseudomonas chlororaphis]MBM0282364.1 hypothetical protein [Pseudomonas chlororaphis]
MNRVSERTSAINSESLQVLAQWLKCNGTRQVRETDPRRMILDRYPAGLFSEAELEALWDVLEG